MEHDNNVIIADEAFIGQAGNCSVAIGRPTKETESLSITINERPEKKEMKDEKNLLVELASLLNRYSVENQSNTPDFLLAEFLHRCLNAFEIGIQGRDKWYGVKHWKIEAAQPLEKSLEKKNEF